MNWIAVMYTIADIAVYSLAGMILLGTGTALVFLLMPFPLRRELRDEQNRALALVMAAVIVGMAIIIGAVMYSPPGLTSLRGGPGAVPPPAEEPRKGQETKKETGTKKAPLQAPAVREAK